ncbi:hypothetical protein Tco_0285192 [Tanacetum coccineum]
MLAPCNYVQWKSRIKRYIDTKPTNELIHYCLQNPPYNFKWIEKTVLVIEGSSETTTEGYMENYKNFSQDIRNQLDAEAEAKVVQIILTWIDNDIYSTVDAYLNAFNEIRFERLARTSNLLALVGQQQPVYHPNHYTQNSSTRSQQAATRNIVNVAEARENVGEDAIAQIQEVTPDTVDTSGPIFDAEPLQKEHGDTNITTDSLDMSNNGGEDDQDEDEDLTRERDLLASLIDKLKCKIDDSKNRNKLLESSNKTLVDKLKGEIEDFKTKNKSLESSNNHFKEANNELSKTNQLMFKDLKKFQAELDRYHDVNYASNVEIDYAKAKGYLIAYKMESQKSFN